LLAVGQRVLQVVYNVYLKLRSILNFIQLDRSIGLLVNLRPLRIKQDGSVSKEPHHEFANYGNSYETIALAILTGVARKFDQAVTV
jgi:hypothetical protein